MIDNRFPTVRITLPPFEFNIDQANNDQERKRERRKGLPPPNEVKGCVPGGGRVRPVLSWLHHRSLSVRLSVAAAAAAEQHRGHRTLAV